MKIRISLKKAFTYLLVTYSYILKPKRLFMSESCSYASPFSRSISIGKLYQIECIINPCPYLFNRNSLSLMRVEASRQNRQEGKPNRKSAKNLTVACGDRLYP